MGEFAARGVFLYWNRAQMCTLNKCTKHKLAHACIIGRGMFGCGCFWANTTRTDTTNTTRKKRKIATRPWCPTTRGAPRWGWPPPPSPGAPSAERPSASSGWMLNLDAAPAPPSSSGTFRYDNRPWKICTFNARIYYFLSIFQQHYEIFPKVNYEISKYLN